MNAPGLPSTEAIAALRAHPRFSEAVRQAAACLIEIYQANRLLNLLLNDRGRAAIGYLALFLHYSRRPGDADSGLTAARLKALCTEQQVCSAGRAEAMLAMMRFAGYIAPAQGAADRRLRLLVPTERLLGNFHARWQCQFRAMALLLPESAEALAALGRPDFPPSFVRHIGESFRAGFRLLGYAPELGLFAERNGAMMVMFSLLTAGAADDPLPPPEPVPVSISAFARRFAVSRMHVLKLLRDAEAEGFIERSGSDGQLITVLPRLSDAAQNFFATAFLFLADRARLAIEETGRESAVA